MLIRCMAHTDAKKYHEHNDPVSIRIDCHEWKDDVQHHRSKHYKLERIQSTESQTTINNLL